MNVKIGKHDAQFKPQIYQRKSGDRIEVSIIKMTSGQEIDHLVEIERHCIEVEEDLVGILDQIMEGNCRTIIGMTTEEINIENKGIGIEVEVKIIIEILIGTVLVKTTQEIVILIETRVGQDKHIPYLEGRMEEIVVD